MIAQHIKKPVQEILGSSNEEYCLRKLSDAIELLCNKGNWDGMTGYITIVPNNADSYMLPAEIETPLRAYRVEDGDRGIFRDRLYEFTANHPGEQLRNRLGFSWSDESDFPFTIMPDVDTKLRVSNAGANVSVTGTTAAGDFLSAITLQEVYENTPTWKAGSIVSVSRTKGAPNTFVNIHAETGSAILPIPTYLPDGVIARYAWDNLEPKYRKIMFLDKAVTVRILYRRRTRKLQCWSQFIPLDNEFALTQTLRGMRLMELAEPRTAEGLGIITAAVQLTNEEQESRNAAKVMAEAGQQVAGASNNTIGMSGMLAVSDIYDKAAAIFGPVGKQILLDEISQSIERLAYEAKWDSLEGFADVRMIPGQASRHHRYSNALTLAFPQWIQGITAIVDCKDQPLVGRTEWIHYHLNGPYRQGVRRDFFDWAPDSPLMRDLTQPTRLVFMHDDNTQASTWTVYGRDDMGRQVRDGNGRYGVDFISVGSNTDRTGTDITALPYSYLFTTIERILRKDGTGGCQVFELNTGVFPGFPGFRLLSIAEEQDTEMLFRRLSVPNKCGYMDADLFLGTPADPLPAPIFPIETAPCFRVAFQRRVTRVRTLADPIWLRNADAMVLAMKSRQEGDDNMMKMAADILHKEMRNRVRGAPITVQYLDPLIDNFAFNYP